MRLISREVWGLTDIVLPVLVPLALALYDYLITLDQEVKQMWKRKLTWISLIFYLNRYGQLLAILLTILQTDDWTGKSTQVFPSNQTPDLILRIISAGDFLEVDLIQTDRRYD